MRTLKHMKQRISAFNERHRIHTFIDHLTPAAIKHIAKRHKFGSAVIILAILHLLYHVLLGIGLLIAALYALIGK